MTAQIVRTDPTRCPQCGALYAVEGMAGGGVPCELKRRAPGLCDRCYDEYIAACEADCARPDWQMRKTVLRIGVAAGCSGFSVTSLIGLALRGFRPSNR